MVRIETFDSSQVEPSEAIESLPLGWFAMQIVGSAQEQAQSGSGQYLAFEFEILESYHPDLKGRKAWVNLNLWNQNQTAVEIAMRDLSAICRATGQPVIDDTDLLHNKPLAVKIKVKKAKGDYPASTEIGGYDALEARFPSSGAAPAQQAPAGSTASTGAAPASKAAPWIKV